MHGSHLFHPFAHAVLGPHAQAQKKNTVQTAEAAAAAVLSGCALAIDEIEAVLSCIEKCTIQKKKKILCHIKLVIHVWSIKYG
jgi:hypothetical protein